MAFVVALLTSETDTEEVETSRVDEKARTEDAIDDDGAVVELGEDESQSPNPDKHPSPQCSGSEPQYSY